MNQTPYILELWEDFYLETEEAISMLMSYVTSQDWQDLPRGYGKSLLAIHTYDLLLTAPFADFMAEHDEEYGLFRKD